MTLGDKQRESAVRGAGVGLKRHFLLPSVVLTAAEGLFLVLPLLTLFGDLPGGSDLLRIAPPVLAGALLIWLVAVWAWLSPIHRVIQCRRRGEREGDALAGAAYRATWRLPLAALVLRTGLWIVAAVSLGLFFMRYDGWAPHEVLELAALAAIHGFVISVARAIWYAAILARVRRGLFPRVPVIHRFADGYGRRLLLVELTVIGGTLAAISAFAYYFFPISRQQYLIIQSFFPIWLVGHAAAWMVIARRWRRPLGKYLDAESGAAGSSPTSTREAEKQATTVYRLAQALPYRLAAADLLLWIITAVAVTWWARYAVRSEADDSIVMLGIILVMAVGGCLYEALWHRETMRPLLEFLTLKHRLPVRGIRTALSLRAKLLVSFGGVVFFACGLALFWGFVQYKTLVTGFVAKQADLGLAWLRSEVEGAVVAKHHPPTPEVARSVLRGAQNRSPEASAIFYYIPDEPHARALAEGGGPMGAPPLPWYVRAQIRLHGDGRVDVDSLALSGRHGRLVVDWHGRPYDLGALAVFYPNYRGRGPSLVRPLKELVVFFLALFGACGGIVLFTVSQFVSPIRMLEERADGMARGELAEPVSSGGEGDEVGRLTFALEEMRRALREKLRSTEEVNLDLERAVQRRTADLAKKNRELAEALEKLTRAQDQLVRSEKMASIGQLVAGIAHEINNPVNAIVNTVGPLGDSIAHIGSDDENVHKEAAEDVRDMLRVVKRGAERTKAIVQALHNYSRTDDESLVAVDINRGIEDSLELLRHVLKQSIKVEQRYGDVARVRGHAGQLNQVFMNLLTNAAQAVGGREGAAIEIETSPGPDSVVIVIRDNGEGIPPDLLQRIFDPFFTTKDVGEGSGLGLSIVHGIVERHGGTIQVDSEVGVGTTFTVTLPRAPAADA